MQNTLFSLHESVIRASESADPSEAIAAFVRTLGDTTFWVEAEPSDDAQSNPNIAIFDGEAGEEPRILAFMRDDNSSDAPEKIAQLIADENRFYTAIPGECLLILSAQINFTLCIINEDEQSLALNSRFLKILALYLSTLHNENGGQAAPAAVTSLSSSSRQHASPSRGGIVEKPKSGAGKIIILLLIAAAVAFSVFSMQG